MSSTRRTNNNKGSSQRASPRTRDALLPSADNRVAKRTSRAVIDRNDSRLSQSRLVNLTALLLSCQKNIVNDVPATSLFLQVGNPALAFPGDFTEEFHTGEACDARRGAGTCGNAPIAAFKGVTLDNQGKPVEIFCSRCATCISVNEHATSFVGAYYQKYHTASIRQRYSNMRGFLEHLRVEGMLRRVAVTRGLPNIPPR